MKTRKINHLQNVENRETTPKILIDEIEICKRLILKKHMRKTYYWIMFKC